MESIKEAALRAERALDLAHAGEGLFGGEEDA